jgi:hypothetical protein
VGAAIVAVFLFVEDTTFSRDPNVVNRAALPSSWFANRAATFFPGTKTQPDGRLAELVSHIPSTIQLRLVITWKLTAAFI